MDYNSVTDLKGWKAELVIDREQVRVSPPAKSDILTIELRRPLER